MTPPREQRQVPSSPDGFTGHHALQDCQGKSNNMAVKDLAFDERVRKKAERAAMPAWDCPMCGDFYRALYRQGVAVPMDAFKCESCGGRQQGQGCARAAFEAAEGQATVAQLRQAAGKHRGRHVAPATPKHLWALN
jgi:hypothetical protein